MNDIQIGFIGQGWIGKNYADNFEERGFKVVRYALEAPYSSNQDKIGDCSIIFVAVPTPTTSEGFNYEAVRSALKIITSGSTVVIKSTLLPGTTYKLQNEFPNLFVLHSPEFLREKTAAHDAANPERNIIGTPKTTNEHRRRAEQILTILPEAPFSKIMKAEEAELVKYAGNCFLYTKVTFMNMIYDLTNSLEADWGIVKEAIINDHRIGDSHTSPVHTSGHLEKGDYRESRGAGGHCFIKDFEGLKLLYKENIGSDEGYELLQSNTDYNQKLLRDSKKDLDLLKQVYGN
jgi:UDPglucose 6-dehydrogenase